MLFYDDQFVIFNTECNLQKAAYKLYQIITEHGVTISGQKIKLMAFKGRDRVRSKIVIDNKIIEQVNAFNYLGNLIPYEKEVEIDNKLNNYWKMTGIMKNVFRPQKTSKKSRTSMYKTLGLPALLYRSENWIIKARDARRITAAEIKYMRKTAGYTSADYTKKHRYCKRTKYNPGFGQNAGIQKKVFATCKKNSPC